MTIIGIIPARGGSKGFPGKNIYKILGKPLIAYSIEAALAAETLDRVIVSTDDEAIAEAARAAGAEVIMRPPEISGDTAPIEAALAHVTKNVEAEGVKVDVVVLMQANVPCRKPGMIDIVVRKLLESEYTAVLSAFEVNQRPEWAKKIVDGKIVPFMECKSYRRQELPQLIMFDGAVEAIRRDVLMKAAAGESGVHTFYGDNMGALLQEKIYTLDLDSADDATMVEAVLRYLAGKKT